MRFLFTRRWLLFGLAVVLMSLGAWRLGEWQFDRQYDREQRNEWTRANLQAEPAPVGDVLSVNDDVAPDQEWLRVRATGEYDAEATVVVRYQTRDGEAGVDLVTPLVTEDGTGLLVNRGWVATGDTGDTGDSATELPEPPAGQVEVIGFVRADATGRGIEVQDASTRAISSREIGETLDLPLYRGFIEAESESPEPTVAVQRVELPDLSEGPHFFYGLQWWFFGALAVFGFAYLVRDEMRGRNDRDRKGQGESQPVSRT